MAYRWLRPFLAAAPALLLRASAIEQIQEGRGQLSRASASAAARLGEMVNRTTLWSSLRSGAHCSTGACVVPAGAVWVLDASMDVETLTVHGTLRWDTSKDDLEIRAEYIYVTGHGRFEIGSLAQPMQNKATIYIKKGPSSHHRWGYRFFSGDGHAEIEIHGRPLARTWTLLSQTAPKGALELHLKDDPQAMGWRVGDRVGIATTSRGHSTVHKITSLGPNVVHLETPLPSEHWGGYRFIVDRRFEMAAEVINLDRSVLITGDHDDFYETKQGLHTSIHGNGYADIRYTRVEYCGQRDVLGRYCLHFHRVGHCPRCIFKGNAVHDSQQVGITIHGTHFSTSEENTIFDARGVGIMTEDGNEMNNTIARNVFICSWYETCSQFWLDQPIFAGIFLIGMTNDLIENRVAGYENCIWTPGAYRGLGIGSATNKVCPAFTPYGVIRGNVNHDCWRFGMYLDDQHPRNLKRDANGFLIDKASCNEFTADGKDNGLSPANIIENEFDWHNMFVGQYALGDVQFVNYTSVNNAHGMYWKSSKNFADGRPYHIIDSTFYNDETDDVGLSKLDVMGPAGPFTFGIANSVFAGGPTGCGALCAGQACGLGGAGGPCNVQYLLHNVDFSRVPASSKRVSFGINSIDQGYVLPMFVADDDSLGGYRSVVSKHMDGFGGVPGCEPAGYHYDYGYGCNQPIRRLNIWGPRSDEVKISGPGYDIAPNDAVPVNGINAGRMEYEPNNGHAYGTPVLVGQTYNLVGNWQGTMVVDFSDWSLSRYFNTPHESVTLQMGGMTCQLKASDDRSWLSPLGRVPHIISTHTTIQGGALVCAAPSSYSVPRRFERSPKDPPVDWTAVPLSRFPECTTLMNVTTPCSESGCKALVSGMTGRSCSQYCKQNGLVCLGAWEEAEGCREKEEMACEEVREGNSDLICECAMPVASGEPSTTTSTTLGIREKDDRATFQIRSRLSGLCLQEPGHGKEQLQVAPCDHMITGQQWTAVRDDRAAQLRSVRGFCLEGRSRRRHSGEAAAAYCVTASQDQLWTRQAGEGLLRNMNGQCVDAPEGTTGVRTRSCEGASRSQEWDFIELAQPARVAAPARLAAEPLAALEEASEAWAHHAGVHCRAWRGARSLDDAAPAVGQLPLAACRARCEAEPGCSGVVVVRGQERRGQCWLRDSLELSECDQGTAYDTWALARSLLPASRRVLPHSRAPARQMVSDGTRESAVEVEGQKPLQATGRRRRRTLTSSVLPQVLDVPSAR